MDELERDARAHGHELHRADFERGAHLEAPEEEHRGPPADLRPSIDRK